MRIDIFGTEKCKVTLDLKYILLFNAINACLRLMVQHAFSESLNIGILVD